MTRVRTEQLLGEVQEVLQEQNRLLATLRDESMLAQEREVQLALDDARNKVAAALHDLRRATTTLEGAWAVQSPSSV